MNPALHFIFSRRSIRKYRDEEIPAAVVTDLLEAAMAAPSARARDPWHFVVVNRRELLDRMAQILPNAPMLKQAPTALVVCGDLNRAHDQKESYLLQDLSAAVQNILLAARALGLGACWLGVHPRPERVEGLKNLLGLPDGIIPMCGVALGWPAEEQAPRTRYNPERVHLNVF